MIRNTNRILIAAAVLAVALTFGNVVAAHAGSNDGGPFRYTTQSNESEARSNVGARRAKRAPAHAASDAYGSYAADRELVPSASAQHKFPRGAQGGW